MSMDKIFMPLMMIFGISNVVMMTKMFQMENMMTNHYFADIDFAYNMGYADGYFGEGGGEFGEGFKGGEGRFMDGGMEVGV